MQNHGSVELKRDCEATEIPAGTVIMLPTGTAVDINADIGRQLHGPGRFLADYSESQQAMRTRLAWS